MTPTGRTLKELRQLGYLADVVERWLPGLNVRKDLFGCIDVVAVRAGLPVLGVQATSASNVAARLKKARGLAALHTWLAAGCGFEVWGWALKNGRWRVRRLALVSGELEPIDLTPRPRRRREGKGLFDDLPTA